jgi:YgiT-type zinc finger domain-containing protein
MEIPTEDTTATVERETGRELFGETTEQIEVPALVCSKCGEVTAL